MSANDLFHIKSKSVTTTLSVESLRFSQIYFLAICLFYICWRKHIRRKPFRKSGCNTICIRQHRYKTRSDVVMIGDRKYDIEGAKANNIDSIGVLYGYGDEEELANAGANKIVTDIKELSSFLLTGNIPI